jgi:peptidoglycan/LPS O-acetylase OafA/YrhL
MITPGWLIALAVIAVSFLAGWLSHQIFYAPLFRSLEKHLERERAAKAKGGAE